MPLWAVPGASHVSSAQRSHTPAAVASFPISAPGPAKVSKGVSKWGRRSWEPGPRASPCSLGPSLSRASHPLQMWMSARLSQACARGAAASTLWAPLSVAAQLDTGLVRTVPSVKVGDGEGDFRCALGGPGSPTRRRRWPRAGGGRAVIYVCLHRCERVPQCAGPLLWGRLHQHSRELRVHLSPWFFQQP